MARCAQRPKPPAQPGQAVMYADKGTSGPGRGEASGSVFPPAVL